MNRLILIFINFISITTFAQLAGDIDTSFITGTGFNNSVNCITIQPDGKILIGGNFTTYNGVSKNRIVRLNSDGSIDNTFNIGSGFNGIVNCITIQTDGKILVGGAYTNYNGSSANRFIRLNSNGSYDNSLTLNSFISSGEIKFIKIQTDNKIIIGGSFTSSVKNYFCRFDADGFPDTSFWPLNSGFDYPVYSFAFQNDGKILVGGDFLTYEAQTQKGIVRMNSTDARTDTSFITGNGFPTIVHSLLIQNDNKIIASGEFSIYNNMSFGHIVRLNIDGSVDSNFNSSGIGFNGIVYDTKLQSDGKIVAVGLFSNYNGISQANITRLNNNGTIDTSFNIGSGFNTEAYKLAIQSDGKILVGGTFTTYKGTNAFRLVRIHGSNFLNTDEFITNESISLFPNPSKDYLEMKLTDNKEIENLEIFDLQGKQLCNFTHVKNKVNIILLANGVYLLKIKCNGKTLTKKFIKN